MSTTPAHLLTQALHARGLRLTPQRKLVLDAVLALGHSTPDQVCARVQRIVPSLSASTVYRTLELLEELGVVTHTHLGHGPPTYHPAAAADHLHLVCRRCGAVQEVDVEPARSLAGAVRAEHGFTADLAHLSLHGWCADCDPQSRPRVPTSVEPLSSAEPPPGAAGRERSGLAER